MTNAPRPQTNVMKVRMAAGELCVGMIVRLMRGVEIAAIAKGAGFDCLYVDLEHCSFTMDTVSQIALYATSLGITPLVRVATHSAGDIGRALEAGAQGIIVPHVETAAQANAAVHAALYPPLGGRSFVAATAQTLFRPAAANETMSRLNAETLVVAMIESATALENIVEIAAVPGVDLLMVGTNDLCNSLGLPGQLEHPQVMDAYDRVARACRTNGKHLGIGGLASMPELAKRLISRFDARYASAGSDVAFLLSGASAGAKAFL